MSLDGCNGAEHYFIVVLALELRRQRVESLIDFDKLFGSFLVIRVVFGMIFNCQFPVCILDVIQSRILLDPKRSIVGTERTREIFIQELLFILVEGALFAKEAIEGGLGIGEGVFTMEHFIIVSAFVVIGKHIKGLRDVVKPCFSSLSMFFVPIGVPFGCQFLKSIFDFKEGGALWDPQDSVVVLDIRIGRHLQAFFGFYYNSEGNLGIYTKNIILDFSIQYATQFIKPNYFPKYPVNEKRRKIFVSLSPLINQ